MIKYLPKDYKKLLIIPIILLIFCLSIISYTYITKGYIFEKSIDFAGGTQATIITNQTELDIIYLEQQAKLKFEPNIILRSTKNDLGISIDIQSKNEITLIELKDFAKENNIELLKDENEKYLINIQSISPSVSDLFFRQAQLGILFAFILMGVVVFFVFKSYIPSLAIILAATIDILFAITMMLIFNIELSLGTLAALLMIIGYSVDTDILLTIKLLKRKDEGTIDERIEDSIKTGLTMTTTGITSLLILYILSPSQLLSQISIVIIFGLIADYITTWLQNVGILRWYIEVYQKKHQKNKKTKKNKKIDLKK
jgi:preprotein translocase subunit SecF